MLIIKNLNLISIQSWTYLLYYACKFTCHVIYRVRTLSTKMNNDSADGHCLALLGRSVTPLSLMYILKYNDVFYFKLT